jgi:hypothetical protein
MNEAITNATYEQDYYTWLIKSAELISVKKEKFHQKK